MALSKEDWTMIGIGVAGAAAGVLGASFFAKGKPVNTGLSRLYRIEGRRKTEVALHIQVNEDGYFVDLDAPYGVAWKGKSEEEEAAGDFTGGLEDELAMGAPFSDAEDAAAIADESMKVRGYTAVDGWLDSLETDLKD